MFNKIFLLILLGLTGCKGSPNDSTSISRPNILFILVDDLRPELNTYGATHIISPNIDQLAQEGIQFNNAYCNFPVCGASRASFLTGMRPTRNRFLHYNTYAEKEAPDAISLPGLLKKNGYYTISNGKVFHNIQDHASDWDELWRPDENELYFNYLTEENLKMVASGTRGKAYERADVPDSIYFDGRIAKQTIANLKKLKNSNAPFFLAAGFYKPHLPFNAPSKYWKIYDGKVQQPKNNYVPSNAPKISIHNNGELKQYREIPKKKPISDSIAINLIQGYYACISYIDAQIGLVLQALKELEMDDNTIIVLMSDHGYNLQEHTLWNKHSNFMTSLRSPLLVKDPRIGIKGKSDALVEYVDIFPTITALAGIEKPSQLEGRSFKHLLENPNQDFKPYIIAKYNTGMTIKTPIDSYTEWIGKDYSSTNKMYYEHVNDWNENKNIVFNPEHKERIESLSKLLKENWGKDF